MNLATERVSQRLEFLASISDFPDCISRFYGTPAFTEAGKLIAKWMSEAGLHVTTDCVGNIRGALNSKDSSAKHFVVGSHHDSVHNAGKYDGPLGILIGLEMAIHVHEHSIELPFHLTIVAFADEEGARFNTSYLGSSVLAGNFQEEWLSLKDDSDKTLKQVVKECGGNVSEIPSHAIPKEDWLGYYEVHIEQGPVLENRELSVCAVTGIAAQQRIQLTWDGTSGHAGTCPMNLREDAYCGAAEFALAVEKLALQHKDKLVATVGKLRLFPNTPNVIPDKVIHTLDIRSSDDSFLDKMIVQLESESSQIASNRRLGLTWTLQQSNPSVKCDNKMNQALSSAIAATGLQAIQIPSGAGHDGVMISAVAPIAMLFVRSKDGISHNPLEFTSEEDIADAIQVSIHFLEALKQKN